MNISTKKLKEKLLKTFEIFKETKLRKHKESLYFNDLYRLCIMTSKVHTNSRQKYWYTLTFEQLPFLDNSSNLLKFKGSYVFLGCLDHANTGYLIPFQEHKEGFFKL